MRALAAVLLLGACAAPPACPEGTVSAATVTLAFGRNGPDGTLRVTDADWSAFLAEEATPRFPDGLTGLNAAGQWRAPDGLIAREPAKLLWLVLPGPPAAETSGRIGALASAYAARFGQDSVLAVYGQSCAGFLRR